ncbi:hypothetical protein [Rosenbergiella collisarenosi]|uniref:hypothetical protein n=1 Tax=Rosenbergiella collisarenosi TaxID=1544695 RepID=UPI001F4EE2EA|nr:hypothetical protein [Rosenbergiella collisarenosi]
MEYAVYFEYTNGRTRSNVMRCQSKQELKEAVQNLFQETELLTLAERIVVKGRGKIIYSGGTHLTFRAVWHAIDNATNPVGHPRKVRDGTPTTLYLPAELKAVLRDKGNGSMSYGLIKALQECSDRKVKEAVTL